MTDLARGRPLPGRARRPAAATWLGPPATLDSPRPSNPENPTWMNSRRTKPTAMTVTRLHHPLSAVIRRFIATSGSNGVGWRLSSVPQPIELRQGECAVDSADNEASAFSPLFFDVVGYFEQMKKCRQPIARHASAR